jgi:hypothetical protein
VGCVFTSRPVLPGREGPDNATQDGGFAAARDASTADSPSTPWTGNDDCFNRRDSLGNDAGPQRTDGAVCDPTAVPPPVSGADGGTPAPGRDGGGGTSADAGPAAETDCDTDHGATGDGGADAARDATADGTTDGATDAPRVEGGCGDALPRLGALEVRW